MIDDFKQRFSLGKNCIVVADSGLLNKTNVALLQKAEYKYVLGTRIKSEGVEVKKWILEQEKKNEGYCEHKRADGERLILSYSETRAKKDAYNRERGVERLGNAYKSGKLTNNKSISGDITSSLR